MLGYNNAELIVGTGKVALIDDTGPVQVGQVQLSAAETKDRMPMMYHFGFASSPPPGSDVVHLSIAGDRNRSMVVASNHQPSRLKNLPVGGARMYDLAGSQVQAGNDNNVQMTAAAGVNAQTPGFTASGNLAVGSGFSGTHLGKSGDIVTYHNGIIINVVPPSGAGGLINTAYYNNLIAQIKSIKVCAELQALINSAMSAVQSEITSIEGQVSFLKPLLDLPTDLGSVISWITNFAKSLTGPYSTLLQQYIQTFQQVEAIASAAAEAAAGLISCPITIPALQTALPTSAPSNDNAGS